MTRQEQRPPRWLTRTMQIIALVVVVVILSTLGTLLLRALPDSLDWVYVVTMLAVGGVIGLIIFRRTR